MPRLYTVPWTGTVTLSGGDTDLWELTPADDKPLKLRGLKIGQISEVGDTAEEGLRIAILRLPATVTSGSGGSAAVPRRLDTADGAEGFTGETNNTTIATTSGTIEVIEEIAWNIRNSPYEMWWPDEDFSPKVKGTEVLIIRLHTTVGDDITFCGTAYIEEE